MAYNRLSTYCTSVARIGNDVAVTYHQTTIVLAKDVGNRRVVKLDTGGETGNWTRSNPGPGSNTTKRKMNQAAHQFGLGYSVHQAKGRWYVTTIAGAFEYEDTVFIFDAVSGLPMDELALFAPLTVANVELALS